MTESTRRKSIATVEVPGTRWQVQMVMNTKRVYLVDRVAESALWLETAEIITEENVDRQFEEIVDAGSQAGKSGEGEAVLCTTFPEDTKFVFPVRSA